MLIISYSRKISLRMLAHIGLIFGLWHILGIIVQFNMVSVSGKRFSDVDDSTDHSNEDSDYEIQNKLSNKVMKIERKGSFSSSVNKQFQSKYTAQENNFGNRFNNNCNRIVKKQKCFSKNALMARENRLKKKLYVKNLEDTAEKYRDENKKLSSILDNQSTVIEDLRKEVKYLKNVLANSTDIGQLLKSINQNLHMSVPSQLNDKAKCHNTSMTTDSANNILHPWSECKSSQEECVKFDSNSIIHDTMLEFPSEGNIPNCIEEQSHDEHNYTTKLALGNTFEDAGVCLHIAKHKISLELCSSCSEQASTSWKED